MNLSDLRLCALLAEERHFGRTAMRASMTQPAVSLALKRVERYYGVRLFDRGRGAVSLTEAGERMLPHIRGILERADALHRAACPTEDETPSQLRIGYSAWTRPAVRSLVCALQRSSDAVSIRLAQAPVPEQRRHLGAGHLDIACLHTAPLDHPRIPAVTFRLSALATSRGARSPGRRILLPDLGTEHLGADAAEVMSRAGLTAGPVTLVGSPEELLDRLLAGEGSGLVDPRMIPTGARTAVSLQIVSAEPLVVPFDFVAAPGASSVLAAVPRSEVVPIDAAFGERASELTA